MATLNLGRIKPVFRDAYSGSTAYVVDDIVTHGNECFICIQAHGAGEQATSQTAYWKKLAAKGTDGTDVGTTITTQGDILYRDGSGLQRLAKGTAGQTLQMNGAANAPTWVTASSGGVLQIKAYHYTGEQGINSTSYTNTNVAVAITPTAADSHFWIIASISAGGDNHDANAVFNVHDSALGSSYSTESEFCFTDPDNGPGGNSTNEGYMSNQWSTGSDGSADNFKVQQSMIWGMYNPAADSSSARTFTVVCKSHQGSTSNGINIGGTGDSGDDNHSIRASSRIEVWEIANGIYS
tara:strand:- start:349 stop:1233 length:885 start_codon:yes stop_codon:yes gene_type:complete